MQTQSFTFYFSEKATIASGSCEVLCLHFSSMFPSIDLANTDNKEWIICNRFPHGLEKIKSNCNKEAVLFIE